MAPTGFEPVIFAFLVLKNAEAFWAQALSSERLKHLATRAKPHCKGNVIAARPRGREHRLSQEVFKFCVLLDAYETHLGPAWRDGL